MMWVPAVPLPFYGLFRKRCVTCGAKFRHMDDYERHYVREHICDEYRPNYECMQEIPLSVALDLGYEPWFRAKLEYEKRRNLRLERREQRVLDRYNSW